MAGAVKALMRKELSAMRPFLAFSVFLVLVDEIFVVLTEYPSQVRLNFYTAQEADAALAIFIISAAFTMAITAGLLVREYDEKTLEFLDSLPITRSRLFMFKITAALGTLMVWPLLGTFLGLPLHALSRDSLHGSWHLELLAQSLFLDFVLFFFLTAAGTLLSFLRRFAWLVALIVLFSYPLSVKLLPALRVLNPVRLIAPPMRGGLYIVPWDTVTVLGLLALLAFFIAWAQFCRGSDWLMWAWGRFQDSLAGKLVLMVVGVPIVVVSLVAFLLWSVDQERAPQNVEVDEDLGNVEVRFPTWETSTLDTELYRISYPSNLRERVVELAPGADASGRKVFDFFQIQPRQPLAVDATSSSPTHYAGLAEWQSITLALAYQDDLRELEGTLVHETAHVLIDQLSQRRLRDHFNTIRVFHEGLASYLEHEWVLTHRRDELRFSAAVLRDRRLFDFQTMADGSRLEAELGSEAIYSLGERLASVMVERMGSDGIVCLLTTPALEAGLRDLQGVPFWQAWLQSCGFDLERLLSAFFRALDGDARRFRSRIDALPRPRGRIEFDEQEGVIEVWVLAPDLPHPWEPVCRFKPDLSSGHDEIHFSYASVTEEGEFCTAEAESMAPNGTFYLQLGLLDWDSGQTIYEPWFQATLDSR